MKRYALFLLLTAFCVLTAVAQGYRILPVASLPPALVSSVGEGIPDLCVLQDAEGFLWYGSRGTGLCRFDGYESEAFRSDRQHPDLVRSNDLLCMVEQRHRAEIWFGTKEGAYILSKLDYSIRPIVVAISNGGLDTQNSPTTQNGSDSPLSPDTNDGFQPNDGPQDNELANKRIADMVAAPDGSVWLCYRNQLLHFSAQAQLLERFETQWHGKNRSITSLCFDGEGTLWAGLWNGGVVCVKKRNVQGAQGSSLWTVEEGPWMRSDYPADLQWLVRRKALCAQTSEGVTLLYVPKTKMWEQVDAAEADEPPFESLSGPQPARIEWLDSLVSQKAPRNDAAVLSWAARRDGSVYVGSYHSLLLCDTAHVERLQGDLGKVRSMAYSESSQTLYLLSKALGVCQWKASKLTVLCDSTSFRHLQLLGDTALLLSDELTGVFRFHLRSRQLTLDTTATDVRPMATAYAFDGHKQLMRFGQQELAVPTSAELVEIHLSTFDFLHAAQVRYAYRLSDDAPWTELPEGEHIVKLTHLPTGTSTLQVRATDAYARWSHPYTLLSLHRSAAWYAHTWLWILLALFSLLAIAYIYNKVSSKKRMLANEPSQFERNGLNAPQPHEPLEPESDDSDQLSVADKEFVDKAVEAVAANITNTDYSVDALASDLCMSRANLHRKMRTITGLTPTEFIRNQRLERAAELLRTTSYSVNEIADLVGFSYASYFTKCFKEKYGVLPKDY